MALRIPQWCEKYSAKVNGKAIKLSDYIKKGYAHIKRDWSAGDIIELELDMPPVLIESNPNVRQNAGRAVIKRGPLIYCIEQEDNGSNLNNIVLEDVPKLTIKKSDGLLSGTKIITAKATRLDESTWDNKQLYRPVLKTKYKKITLKAIPYFLWANRSHGQMLMWIRKER